MCGIAGIFRKDYQPVDLKTLEAMAEAMFLRGPDGKGFHIDGSFGLAHRRLSILDIAGGAQPIANEDNTVFTVVNGEFYNYLELRKSLERKGHRFRTNSDSECAVHLYEEYGTVFPEHLTGMFALAVYDARKKSLFLARDRAGEKPLFLLNTKELFAFASDLNALKCIPGVDWALNYDALADYLAFMYTPGRATVYRNVTRLEPGKSLLISANATAFQSYWTLNPEAHAEVGFGTAAQRVRKMVTESVRSSLLADVPLGVFLSGGLDSTIIAAAASQVESPEPLRCFSIGFDDPAYDESRQAERNAEYLRKRAKRKIEFYHKVVQPEDFASLEFLLSRCGEPYGDSSILPTYLLCKFAREKVTVALSGDGADELFGGYERYLVMNKLRMLDVLPEVLRRDLFAFAARLFPDRGGDRTRSARIRRLLIAAGRSAAGRYASLISGFSGAELQKFCRFEISPERPDVFERWFDASLPNAASLFDYHVYLPNDILRKTDTASMSVSLEVRAPFLEYRLTEFAESLPDEYKMQGMRRKVVLAEAFGDLIPPELRTNRKRGFGIPLASWFRGAWYKPARERLLDGRHCPELFDRTALERLLSEHLAGRADHSKRLYTLLALELGLSSFQCS